MANKQVLQATKANLDKFKAKFDAVVKDGGIGIGNNPPSALSKLALGIQKFEYTGKFEWTEGEAKSTGVPYISSGAEFKTPVGNVFVSAEYTELLAMKAGESYTVEVFKKDRYTNARVILETKKAK